ncbi:MAG: B12-binding domain-containing protein [Thermodesulfobacteriota bacterium]
MNTTTVVDLNSLIENAQGLSPIPAEAVFAYEDRKDLLIEQVDQAMKNRPDIAALLGYSPQSVMFDNHRNHFHFMLNVFKLNHFELLARTVPWVYRSYHAHGFSYDYFPATLEAWIKALGRHLDPAAARVIVPVYRWMVDHHQQMISLSKDPAILPPLPDPVWQKVKEVFLSALLRGEHRSCLRLAEERVKAATDLPDFYLQVIQPSLYEIGRLWEEGEISVAQEHLASAMVSRVMAALSPRFTPLEYSKGRAVVTSAPNEFHAIGGWMVSDLLEMDGWQVQFLGPNTPERELVTLLKEFLPHLLSLSIIMPFNLDRARGVIQEIKKDPGLQEIRIMVGGLVFQNAPSLWKQLGADGFAADARAAATLAQQWWRELQR